ncbi:ATP-dependent Clp protease proteolytic subunit [Candidatus Leptofilum sp.]|uniref:ATP-dependent Clp protease proteolytic subunit n=1 Tax=Candidatus Leptofilum sp. TaxID=3241576 RepID=UPI003B5AD291
MIRFEEEQETAENNEKPRKSMLDRLLETRTITIFGEINMKLAQEVTEKLMLLAADSDDDIKIFINSPGGHVESGDTIFDMIRFVKPTVKVVGTGWVASAGALIYAAVDRENRYSLPNTRFLLHQPMGGVRGQAQDIKIEAEEIIKMRERLNRIFSEQTGQPLEKVAKDTERNFWMSAQEAIDYGLVGKIINSAEEAE